MIERGTLKDKILEVADGTKTMAQIAVLLGTSVNSVNGCVQRYGLHKHIKRKTRYGFLPEPNDRPDGLEVLAFHRGRWRHVKWSPAHGWSLGYGGLFILDGNRAFAPLPPKPKDAEDFYTYKE